MINLKSIKSKLDSYNNKKSAINSNLILKFQKTFFIRNIKISVFQNN